MTMLRAFIAIELPSNIQQGLDQISSSLQRNLMGIPVRWIPIQNIHLTLMFLGDVSLTNLDLVKENLEDEISNHITFDVVIGKLGAFPVIHKPRVIWIGVEPSNELSFLQSGLEHRMTRLGYPGEERAFSPHLTLGRVSRNIIPSQVRIITQELLASNVGFLGSAHVDMIHLFRSDLHSDGAIYSKIQSYTLVSKG